MTPERLAFFNRVFDNRQTTLTVVNDGIHKQQNLSAVMRTCDAFGVSDLHRVFDRRAARTFRGTALGSQKWLNIHTYKSTREALVPLKEQGMQIIVTHLSDDSKHYREIDYTVPTAIVLGNEKTGVSEDAIELADHCVTIPMYGAVESFNVSVAAAIILSEAERQRVDKGMYGERTLDPEVAERIMFEISQPTLAQYCKERGIAFPPLNEHGELDNATEWIERIRNVRKNKLQLHPKDSQ
ncbi:MAG: tRNA (guanosine(18)-2'-O)-methyltransferase TrmH [Gammaproteobacteria bacterium]|nr:tRNA (guanosine(18)-2'-O)-methyltransferase TrmH [Gammaproteobacteria bacterium]